MKKLYADYRWIGDHGIGRMAREVFGRMECSKLPINGNPSSPFEPLRMFFTMGGLPKNATVLTLGYNSPIFVNRDFILTICDLNYVDRSENSGFLRRFYFNFLVKRACKKARVVLTISEFSKTRILRWANISSEKVVNIGCGVSDIFYSSTITPWRPGYEYYLCVSNRKKHKNEENVIQAFAKARIDKNIKLIFTGRPSPELDAMIGRLGQKNRTHFLGRIDDEFLVSMYKGSKALIFPSLYEGFGLPVAEAMACGTPVITSSVTSLPEVGKDAVIYVNPYSIDEIASAIESVQYSAVNITLMCEKARQYSESYRWELVVNRLKQACDGIIQ